jgi:hypothetical protein
VETATPTTATVSSSTSSATPSRSTTRSASGATRISTPSRSAAFRKEKCADAGTTKSGDRASARLRPIRTACTFASVPPEVT